MPYKQSRNYGFLSFCFSDHTLYWFSGRWQQLHIRGRQVQCCSQRGERIQLLRAPQRIRQHLRSRSLLAPPHTRLGLLYPAEYRLPTPNSCAELDETRRPSSDPPFTTTPQ